MLEQCAYKDIRIDGIKHIEFPFKFNLLNKLFRNKFDDMRYFQFVCLAKNKT